VHACLVVALKVVVEEEHGAKAAGPVRSRRDSAAIILPLVLLDLLESPPVQLPDKACKLASLEEGG